MKSFLSRSSIIVFLFLATGNGFGQASNALPRSSPEMEGVSSAGIDSFLDAAAKSKNEFHSVMIVRHGKVIAEGWWNPYRADLRHTMYSTSKSFTATAIGFAVQEKKLQLTDKVVSFFPRYLPDTVSAFLSELTVRDVLSMTDGQDPDPTFSAVTRDSNWVRSFLTTPFVYKPGTQFLYNTLGTYILSAIVQQVTGQKEIDYLRPRLFEPLGIRGMDWETDPMGINTGGWGLRIKTEDMAKFGQLFLQKGKWKGKQLLPTSWIDEASTIKILQHPDRPQSARDSSDWEQGYCYQMWRCRHNAYRADGAFGQFIIVMPEQDAVIAITAETADMQNEINLVWDYLLPAMRKGKLRADPVKAANLRHRLSALALPPPATSIATNMEKRVSGKVYSLSPNEKKIAQVEFEFKDGHCRLILKTDTVVYSLDFARGKWQAGKTNRMGPNLLAKSREDFSLLAPFKIAASYGWKDEHSLQLVLRYIESPHSEIINCYFNDKAISLEFANSTDFGNKTIVLKGESRN